MSSETDFDEAIRAYGGALRSALLPDGARKKFERLRERAQKRIAFIREVLPRLPEIHFDFVDNPDIQAFAFKFNGKHFVGMFAGAILAMHRLFCRMLADRRILPTIGDATREQLAEPFNLSNLSIVHPIDQSRRNYAGFLEDMAFDFLLSHELHHIIHGHVDFLESQKHTPFISEMCWKPSTADEAMLRQTLEMDADAMASCDGTRIWRSHFEDPSKLNPTFKQLICPDPATAGERWSFAVFSFFRVFGDDSITGADLATLSHPPFRARHYLHTVTSASYVLEKCKESLGRPFITGVVQAVPGVERAFQALSKDRTVPLGLKEAYSDAGKDYAILLKNYWQTTLRDRLAPFAYKDELPA